MLQRWNIIGHHYFHKKFSNAITEKDEIFAGQTAKYITQLRTLLKVHSRFLGKKFHNLTEKILKNIKKYLLILKIHI